MVHEHFNVLEGESLELSGVSCSGLWRLLFGGSVLFAVCLFVCLFSSKLLSSKTRVFSLEASYKIFKGRNCPLSFKAMKPGANRLLPTTPKDFHYAFSCAAPLSINNLPSL